ncbi:MFS transporter, partial [Streptomyces sp. NRRL F-6602]
AALRARAADEEKEKAGGGEDGSLLPMAALVRLAMPAAAVQLAVFLFGFSQFEATAPLVSERLMQMGLFVVSILLAVNVVVIVSTQRLVTRLLEGRPETDGLRIAVGLWTVGYAVA